MPKLEPQRGTPRCGFHSIGKGQGDAGLPRRYREADDRQFKFSPRALHRRALAAGGHSLPPGCDIGAEVHEDRDQFFRFEGGSGQVDIDDNTYDVVDGSGVIVPAGARHNVRNTGDEPLQLYTIYGPPEHRDGVVQATKADADARHHDEEWDGGTTE